ncbi:MAG: hypothetical protein WD011_06400 [Nitriliruptoraceae bacterium]
MFCRPRPLATATIALAALLVAACGSGAEPPAIDEPASDAPSEEPADEPADDSRDPDEPNETGDTDAGDDPTFTAATCEGAGITVDYPADWTIITAKEVPPCRVFHPEPIEFQHESFHYAVRIYIDAVAYEDATGSSLDEELDRREVTVDGRDAVRIERRSTGAAMLPEGESSTTYIVDLDSSILVATTSTVGETDYESDVDVLDAMMDNIEIAEDAA